MRSMIFGSAVLACVMASSQVMGQHPSQTKAERCDVEARMIVHNERTQAGLLRGAAVGAAGGAIVGGNIAQHTAVGLAVGAARRVMQRERDYHSYFDECINRP
jgi:hypothetical protein